MPLELSCPTCSKSMRLADSVAGHTILCPRCGTRIKVANTTAAKPTHHESLSGDLEVVPSRGAESKIIVRKVECPCCRGPMGQGAAVCIRCGYDRLSGKRPTTGYQAMDEVEEIGSRMLGTWTEFIFRRDPKDGWVMIFDSWKNGATSAYVRVVLKEYREAWVSYFQTSADSGTMTVLLVDYYGQKKAVYTGDGAAMQWVIDRLHRAGLEIRRS